MSKIDCIENLSDYAVTGQTSIYGEDSITAKALIMKCARTMRECIKVLFEIDKQVNNTNVSTFQPMFYPLYHEDSKSLIELAGDIYKANNDCITFIDELAVKVAELDSSKTEQVKTLRESLNSAYVDIYDDCAMNILELAGLTGAVVNDCIEQVNKLYEIAIGVESPDVPDTPDSPDSPESGGNSSNYIEDEETLII